MVTLENGGAQQQQQPPSLQQQQENDTTRIPFKQPPSIQQQQENDSRIPFKRQRKSMFDVKPEDIGMLTPIMPTDQPMDNGSGELAVGPGGGGYQPRSTEAKKALPKLDRPKEELLAQAKRYAMEQSVQHVLNKQKVQQVSEISNVQDTAQKQRAMTLMCRLYIGSINFTLNEESIRMALIPFGSVKHIEMSRDPITQAHKGFAFVDFDLPEGAQLCLDQLNNIMLGGRNLKVGRPSNTPQAGPLIEQVMEEAKHHARIYVSSIHPDLSEADIKTVFEAFGDVMTCDLTPDALSGKHKGYGFIEFKTHQSATDAIVAMNLFDLGGQYLRVGKAITPPDYTQPPSTAQAPAAALLAVNAISTSFKTQETVSQLGLTSLNIGVSPISNMSAFPTPPTPSLLGTPPPIASQPSAAQSTLIPEVKVEPQYTAAAAIAPPVAVAPAGLTDKQQIQKLMGIQPPIGMEQNLAREENLEISGKDARYMMMQKLTRGSAGSPIVVLNNMVDVDDVDDELQTEVTEEVSKYGQVVSVIIYQEKQGEEEDAETIVKIFVEFGTSEEGQAAIGALDGRWFGGRSISAKIYDEDKFRAQDFSL